jgi:hypothetical protein
MAEVVSPFTGAVEQFLSPYQRPAYQNIQAVLVDSNGDGVFDEVVFTARRGRKRPSTVYTL